MPSIQDLSAEVLLLILQQLDLLQIHLFENSSKRLKTSNEIRLVYNALLKKTSDDITHFIEAIDYYFNYEKEYIFASGLNKFPWFFYKINCQNPSDIEDEIMQINKLAIAMGRLEFRLDSKCSIRNPMTELADAFLHLYKCEMKCIMSIVTKKQKSGDEGCDLCKGLYHVEQHIEDVLDTIQNIFQRIIYAMMSFKENKNENIFDDICNSYIFYVFSYIPMLDIKEYIDDMSPSHYMPEIVSYRDFVLGDGINRNRACSILNYTEELLIQQKVPLFQESFSYKYNHAESPANRCERAHPFEETESYYDNIASFLIQIQIKFRKDKDMIEKIKKTGHLLISCVNKFREYILCNHKNSKLKSRIDAFYQCSMNAFWFMSKMSKSHLIQVKRCFLSCSDVYVTLKDKNCIESAEFISQAMIIRLKKNAEKKNFLPSCPQNQIEFFRMDDLYPE